MLGLLITFVTGSRGVREFKIRNLTRSGHGY